MRNDEKDAATAFSQFLAQRGIEHEWKQGDNPPDAVFIVGQERWAVEETGLHRYFSLEGQAQSDKAIDNPTHALTRVLNERCKINANTIYVLSLNGVYPFWKDSKELIAKIQEYIDSGNYEETSLDPPLELNPFPYWEPPSAVSIRAFDSKDDIPRIVVLSTKGATAVTPDGRAYVSSVFASVGYAITDILKKKGKVFARLNNYTRRILLLTRVYEFAETRIVRDVLAAHPLVQSYQAGIDGEGGDGVTVAKLQHR